MPNIDKIIQKMKRQPNGIRFQELQKVLEYNGYSMKSKKGTSHRQFINSKRRCSYNKRRKSVKSCVYKRCIKKNRKIIINYNINRRGNHERS